MPTPAVLDFPVKRPNYIQSAQWLGPDDDLSFQVTFPDMAGVLRQISFSTNNNGSGGEICLPSSSNLANLGSRARDILVAHTRMACMVKGRAIPGSKEFESAFVDQLQSVNLQTALGTVKISSVTVISDLLIDIKYQQGNGPLFTVQADHNELGRYVFSPDTQLLVIAGSVEKQFPTYVHDYPNNILSSQQRADVITYVLGLSVWI